MSSLNLLRGDPGTRARSPAKLLKISSNRLYLMHSVNSQPAICMLISSTLSLIILSVIDRNS